MKNIKSLTCLLVVLLVSACTGQSSAAFSSSIFDSSSNSEESSETSSNSSSTNSSSASSASSSNSSSSSSQYVDNTVYYDGYYSSLVSWTNGEDLKNQLNAIIRNGYTPLSYTRSGQNYATNINADHTKYDFEYLDIIYTATDIHKSETHNKGWQREHAWCASLMCGSDTGSATKFKGRATDFHNLFAASANGNMSRQNSNYGYPKADEPHYKDCATNNGQDGYRSSDNAFEPGNIDKGRLARAIFYMATMYKDPEQDTVNNINMKGLSIVEEPVSYVAGNNCKFQIGGLSTLLDWNNTYAVDYLEMQHNVAVYSSTDNPDKIAQGNRNPYVDYPELVDYVYGSKKNMPGALKYVRAAATYLDSENDHLSHYAIKEAKREYSYGETVTVNDVEVIGVLNNYQTVTPTETITNSFANHTFVESDGDSVEVVLTTSINQIKYQINLDQMGTCSNVATLGSSGISQMHNQEQEVTFGGIPFVLKYMTSLDDSETFYIRNISAGGVTLGSGNSPLTGFVLKTKNSYSIDKAYIKAYAGNDSSEYTLVIKVGDYVLLDETEVINNNNKFKVFGNKYRGALTGQITYTFVGNTALRINSVAFDQIIA